MPVCGTCTSSATLILSPASKKYALLASYKPSVATTINQALIGSKVGVIDFTSLKHMSLLYL